MNLNLSALGSFFVRDAQAEIDGPPTATADQASATKTTNTNEATKADHTVAKVGGLMGGGTIILGALLWLATKGLPPPPTLGGSSIFRPRPGSELPDFT